MEKISRLVMGILIAAIAIGANCTSASAFRWPWDRAVHHRYYHYHHRRLWRDPGSLSGERTTPFAEPRTDCQEILDAKRQLDRPDPKTGLSDHKKWNYQLDLLTEGQRDNIAKCIRESAP
jgi:hypothetical protein